MKDIIWESTLDSIYLCEVVRLTNRTGQLTVKNNQTNNILFNQEVGLSYGAEFGPDMDDVAHWQDLCIGAVDGVDNA